MTRHEANVYLAAILETVEAMPEGAPSGPMYAVLMGKMNLTDYEMLVETAMSAGLLTKSSHVLYITDKGRDMVKKIQMTRIDTTVYINEKGEAMNGFRRINALRNK